MYIAKRMVFPRPQNTSGAPTPGLTHRKYPPKFGTGLYFKCLHVFDLSRGVCRQASAECGDSDLTIQRILRHSDVSTTRKAYIKTLPQQTLDGMALFQATVSKSAIAQ